ncbi:beta-galactosidase [Devosia rhodophyticola]|uniref:Beta-galactosidase n=1 Tax=Devosia rhodophyticola TaxID=3026423 RepID=A0ABY7YXU8_9HYPH|nr:beta-galactosidase [Devosia rhodophyticola]WDR06146.1 beta-galactosidase [Devosia rhodophyticola]
MSFGKLSRQTMGVCYYPEHWPEDRWPIDAKMMRDAGITHVRIGEFAWSLMEPNPGQYDWGWLDRAFQALALQGLKIVLGTPTATPPKWLVDEMPDLLPIGRDGRVRGFGSRRHYCFSHHGYRTECARITEALAKRYGNHEALVAWQTDNEYGCHDTTYSYSPAALAGFRAWLVERYGDIAALNAAWGTVFWSMVYRSFDEIELPSGTVTTPAPAHSLDFRRYSSDQVVAFNQIQTEIIRRNSPGRAIAHNFMGKYTDFDHYAVSKDLDIASWDAYPLGFLEREIGDDALAERYTGVGDPDFDAFHHDLYRSCGQLRNGKDQGRWWIMEQQPPGPLNWGKYNPAPKPGAGRLWVWEAFAAGAEVVCYFRWRQPSFAQEQMHEGLLLPDGRTNYGYELCKQISSELDALQCAPASDRSSVALVFDYESIWSLDVLKPSQDMNHFDAVMRTYRALRRAGVNVDIIPPEPEAVAGRKLVLLPTLVNISAELVTALQQSHAVVLAGPLTGSKGKSLNIADSLPPGHLRSMIDIAVRRVESRRPSLPYVLRNGGNFVGWLEEVIVEPDVEIIEKLDDGRPAVLKQGQTIYVAGMGDDVAMDRIVRATLDLAGVEWFDLPTDIRLRDNGPMRFIFNYGSATLDLKSLFNGHDVASGSLEMRSCDVTILRTNKATQHL